MSRGSRSRRCFRGDAAFASPDNYEFLEAEGLFYAIRIPKDHVLQESVAHLLGRPVRRPRNHVLRYYVSFSYRAGTWHSLNANRMSPRGEWLVKIFDGLHEVRTGKNCLHW